MGKDSKIEWTDHTFNPWIGCTKVDELCTNCYAENNTFTRFKRSRGQELWGKGKPRHRTAEAMWKEPLTWNTIAQPGIHHWQKIKDFTGIGEGWTHKCSKCGSVSDEGGIKACPDGCENIQRPRVFSASMADWLDEEVPIEWLADFLKLIHDTPNLDWLLLTKRPENWYDRISTALIVANGGDPTDKEWFTKHGENFPKDEFAHWLNEWTGGDAPKNIWIGTSVGTQKSADTRIPQLLQIPAKIRFLSCEPLLGKVEFSNVTKRSDAVSQLGKKSLDGIHWLICGGESGSNARPMHPAWARSLREQSLAAGVAFFFKQWGEWLPMYQMEPGDYYEACNSNKKFIQSGDKEQGWFRVGKADAGRLLDGREWSEFPNAL